MKTNETKSVRVSVLLEQELKAFREKNYPYATFPKVSQLYVERNKQLEADLEYLRRQNSEKKTPRKGLL